MPLVIRLLAISTRSAEFSPSLPPPPPTFGPLVWIVSPATTTALRWKLSMTLPTIDTLRPPATSMAPLSKQTLPWIETFRRTRQAS